MEVQERVRKRCAFTTAANVRGRRVICECCGSLEETKPSFTEAEMQI